MDSDVSVIALGMPEMGALVVALATVIYGLIRFFINKEMEEINALKNDVSELKLTSVTRTEFNETVKIIRDEVRQGNDATQRGLGEVHRRLDALLLKMAEEA